MKQEVGETLAVSRLELWRRAKTQSDLEAWTAFQQSLEETVMTWFHEHPVSQAVCRLQSDRHFVALAFKQFWHIVVHGQVACETLSEVLLYLRASLNEAILQTLRISSRPGTASDPWPDGEGRPDRGEIWDRLQAHLSSQRERRLAYLLYHRRHHIRAVTDGDRTLERLAVAHRPESQSERAKHAQWRSRHLEA